MFLEGMRRTSLSGSKLYNGINKIIEKESYLCKKRLGNLSYNENSTGKWTIKKVHIKDVCFYKEYNIIMSLV